MLSSQKGYGTSVAEIAPTKGSKSVKYYLLGLIVALALVSVAGSFAHAPGNAVSRAVIGAHQSKPDAVECARYDKLTTITKNQQMLTVPYAKNMRVTFNVKITGTAFGNVLQLGGQDKDEFPGIFFNTGQPLYHLDFTFAKEGVTGNVEETVEIERSKDYKVQVDINDLKAYFYLDGSLVADITIPAELKPSVGTHLPVFASSNFNNAAGGTVHDLEVCSSSGTLPTPRYACQREFGPFTMTKGLQIASVDLGENYELSFKVTVAVGSGNGDLFQIGKDHDNEAPMIHWLNNGDVYFYWDTPYGGEWRPTLGANHLHAGSEAHVRVRVQGVAVTIFVDGTQEYSGSMGTSSKLVGHNIPVYASNPHRNPAQGSIRDVEICNF